MKLHIHRYKWGKQYDHNWDLTNWDSYIRTWPLKWKKDKTCRCGKSKTFEFKFGDGPVFEGI